MQSEHQPPAHHVARVAIGLDPLPGRTEVLRQGAPGRLRVRGDQRAHLTQIARGDPAAAVREHDIHGGLTTTAPPGTQAPHPPPPLPPTPPPPPASSSPPTPGRAGQNRNRSFEQRL